jgi:hypothetical protein
VGEPAILQTDATPLDAATATALHDIVEALKARGVTSAQLSTAFATDGLTAADYKAAVRLEPIGPEARGALVMLSFDGILEKRMIDQGALPGPVVLDEFADIPAAMRAARRWLLWKSEPNADPAKKPRKTPWYVQGQRRNGALDTPEDTARLATFDEALAALRGGGYAGLGFALGPDGTGNAWQGVDLDDLPGRPELQMLADDLRGYVETSPSGRGLHAIGYGAAFDSLGSNSTGIEAYARGRYFTVTGESAGLGEPTCLAEFVNTVLVPRHAPRRKNPPPAAVNANDRAQGLGGSLLGSLAAQDLRSALTSMRSDDRDLWISMGHALRGLGDQGRGLWLEWSQASDKYDPADAARTWDSFKPERTSYRVVFAEAQRRGWANPRARREVERPPPAPQPIAHDQPLFDPWERYTVPAFPTALLPPPLRRFAEYQARSTGVDPAAAAMAALVACSGAIDQRTTLKMKRTGAWVVRPRLWGLLVGDPATAKSPAIRASIAPLRAEESRLGEIYKRELTRWEALDKKERGDPPPKPTRYIFNDLTSESVGSVLSRQDRGALVEQEELSGFIGAMDKYSGGKGSSADRSFWAQAYDGGPKTVDRISRGEIFINNLCVAFLGAIQPDRLAEMANLTSDGLLQRFLPVMMRRANFPAEVENDAPAADYASLISYLVSMKPCAYQMDEGGRSAAEEFQRFIFDLQGMGEGLGKSFSTFAGKLNGAHGSLSLLLHILEDPTQAELEPVAERTVRNAAEILKTFTIPHALEFYRSTTDGGDWNNLRAIASFVLTSDRDRFTPSDLTSKVWALKGKTPWQLSEALAPLAAGGWLEEEAHGAVVKAWSVRAGVREHFIDRRAAEIERKSEVMSTLKALGGRAA